MRMSRYTKEVSKNLYNSLGPKSFLDSPIFGSLIFLTQNLADQMSFKPSQVRTGHVRTGQVRTGPVRTGQLGNVKSGYILSGQAHLGQVKLDHVKSV